jgi:hypothetical protein
LGDWDNGREPLRDELFHRQYSFRMTTYPEVTADTATGLTVAVASGASVTVSAGILYTTSLSNQGTIYRTAAATVNKTDANAGTVVYQGDNGTIQDYTVTTEPDYRDLTIDSYGKKFTLGVNCTLPET